VTRPLPLTWKLVLALGAALFALLSVFLAVLVPLQREQHERVLARDQRLLATLREKYERDVVYDILSENEGSLALSLSELASEPGLLWARLETGGRGVLVTTHPEVVGAGPGDGAGPDARAFLVRDDGTVWRVTVAGLTLVPGIQVARESWPQAAPGRPSFEEIVWRAVPALRHVAELRAGDEVFGRIEIVSSLAEVERSEALTRRLVYALVGATFLVLLLLLSGLVTRLVIVPVRRVLAAMDEVRRGRLEARLSVTSGDEIGRMAEAFNAMAADIETSRHAIEEHSRNLERVVEERTRELRRVSAHLETVIAQVQTGVLSVGPDGRIATFNERAAEILGVDREAVPGRDLLEVLEKAGAGRLAEPLAGVRSGAAEEAHAQVNVRLRRGRRTLSVGASSLGPPGRSAGMVVVVDDLTEILSSQRLSSWKEAVERVIHEIKNPLTPIGLSAQALQTAFAGDRAHFDRMFPEAAGMILRSVQQLKDLIGEFTRFYRLPKVVLRPQPLNPIVSEALAVYAGAEPNGIRIASHLAEGLPPVEADLEPLKRVLLNVMNNGFEAMEGRGGVLEVKTGLSDVPGFAAVTVSDQGVGIEDVERIYDPYYTTKPKGTGLGLLISRQIVEEHGGEIRIRSEVGVGTTVEILLQVEPRPA
jgi:two-component system nitrogen regulation sensor histidine kinase NtrY